MWGNKCTNFTNKYENCQVLSYTSACLNPCIFLKTFQQNLCSNDESETCCWLSYDMFYPLQHIALEWKEMDPYVNITTSNIYYDFFCASQKWIAWWAKFLDIHIISLSIFCFFDVCSFFSLYYFSSVMILGLMWY